MAYSDLDPYWKFLFQERLERYTSSKRKQGKVWDDSRYFLSLLGDNELLLTAIELRFPDGDSIRKSLKYSEKRIIPNISFSIIDSGGYLRSIARKKGYGDKGSLPSSNTKLTYGTDSERYKFSHLIDLINERGEFLMENEKSLKEVLKELHEESLESLLDYVKRINRERDTFEPKSQEDMLSILQDESLTSDQKIERIMKNERIKSPKSSKP